MTFLNGKLMRSVSVVGLAVAIYAMPFPKDDESGLSAGTAAHAATNFGSQKYKRANTKSEILINENVNPMLHHRSVDAMNNAIAFYDNIVRRGGWPEVSSKRILTKGSKGNAVVALRQRLAAEGYNVGNSSAKKFDAQLASAVREFQARHGLAVDGKVARNTMNALNVPAFNRLHTLRQNLPRVEKYAKDLDGRYVIVNIPAAQLEAVEFGRVYSRHNTVVGKKSRPSPILSSKISELNFNPYWHAPSSIVEKDILPEVRKNIGWLKKMNIRIFDGHGGPEVDPRTIDFETVDPKRYLFRQEPGGSNAMASVKINFPNKYAVYLHDTPTKQLFKLAGRYHSSGCVRVDKVHVLTEWLLRGQEDWNNQKIKQLAETEERLDVEIQNRPQLRMAYLTSWAQPDGAVHFRPDIYNLDGTGFVAGQPVPPGENQVAYAPDGSLLDSQTGLQLDENQLQEEAKQREQQQSSNINSGSAAEKRRRLMDER
ncbi:MAG: L,D-transpeptidase family protein [Hyphomicrobiales bacterium]